MERRWPGISSTNSRRPGCGVRAGRAGCGRDRGTHSCCERGYLDGGQQTRDRRRRGGYDTERVLRGLVNDGPIQVAPADEQDLAVCGSLIDHHFTTHCSSRTIGCGALKQSSRTTRSLPARPRSGADWSGNHGQGQLATGPARRAGRRIRRRCTGTRSTRPVQLPRHRLRSQRPSRTRLREANVPRTSTARGRACVLGRRRRRLEIYEQMCPSPCFNSKCPAPGTG